jgi:hypothetical protein
MHRFNLMYEDVVISFNRPTDYDILLIDSFFNFNAHLTKL